MYNRHENESLWKKLKMRKNGQKCLKKPENQQNGAQKNLNSGLNQNILMPGITLLTLDKHNSSYEADSGIRCDFWKIWACNAIGYQLKKCDQLQQVWVYSKAWLFYFPTMRSKLKLKFVK